MLPKIPTKIKAFLHQEFDVLKKRTSENILRDIVYQNPAYKELKDNNKIPSCSKVLYYFINERKIRKELKNKNTFIEDYKSSYYNVNPEKKIFKEDYSKINKDNLSLTNKISKSEFKIGQIKYNFENYEIFPLENNLSIGSLYEKDTTIFFEDEEKKNLNEEYKKQKAELDKESEYLNEIYNKKEHHYDGLERKINYFEKYDKTLNEEEKKMKIQQLQHDLDEVEKQLDDASNNLEIFNKKHHD